MRRRDQRGVAKGRGRSLRGAWLAWLLAAAPAGAEITTDGSLGPTLSLTPVNHEYLIGDSLGRYSEGGANLFHSFGLFNVELGQTASFSADGGTPARIIARVTQGSPSLIEGRLRTLGGAAGADLYLLNPSGVTFGRDADLDVQGSFHVSTAERLRFAAGADFDATSTAPDPPLSVAAPVAFGFLGAATPGLVRFNQSSGLDLPAGETFSVAAGAVSMTGSNLIAIRVPSGRIQLAAVDRAADVPIDDLSTLTGAALAAAVSPDDVPDITLEQGFDLDVSAPAGGTAPAGRVVIRGGSLVIDDSQILAVHRSLVENAAAPAIDVETARSVEIRAGGLLSTRSSGGGRSGGTAIVTERARFDGAGSGIESQARGSGEGGPVSLTASELVLVNGGRIFGESQGAGPGARIEIRAENLEASAGGQILSIASAAGAGGALTIWADRVFVSNEADAANPAAITSLVGSAAAGEGGDLTLFARELEIVSGGGVTTRTEGTGAGGDLAIRGAERVLLRGMDTAGRRAALTASTLPGSTGHGGALDVEARVVEVFDGGQMSTNTQGLGDAGPLAIVAAERVSVIGGAHGPSFISSDSRFVQGALELPGGGGDVSVDTELFELRDGGRLTASTDGARDAGSVRVTARDVVISGVDPVQANPSAVQSRSNADLTDGGDGGAIEIAARGDVTISDLGELSSSTVATGDAGSIDVAAGGSIRLAQARVTARAEGTSTGDGGSIELNAAQGVFLSSSTSILAESQGFGLAGDVTIDAGTRFEAADSTIETEARFGSGGRITIVADQIVWLKDSSLATSVLDGAGGGGDISIDPEFVVLDQSQILAQAETGAGGNITITAGTFFSSPDSVVDASSELGIDGTVSIVAPDTDVTSGITTLPSDVLDATALMRTACSAAVAEGGSFVVSARHPGLPASPDALLAAFDSVDGAAAVSGTAPASQAAARVAIADPHRARGCSRAREEVL